MIKKILVAAMIVIAVCAYNAYETNDSIATDLTEGETYEVTGIVTEVDRDLVVFEANMPDGSIHVWTCHGSGYEVGQLVKIVFGDNDTPNRYNDDGINRVYIIRSL